MILNGSAAFGVFHSTQLGDGEREQNCTLAVAAVFFLIKIRSLQYLLKVFTLPSNESVGLPVFK